MSKREHEGEISDTKSKTLKKALSIDQAKTEIVSRIIEQIKDVLKDPVNEKHSTDGGTIKEKFNQFWMNSKS